MPGNDNRNKKQKIASSNIDLDGVINQFLKFCENATCSSEGTVSWPLHSIRKSLGISSNLDNSSKPKNDSNAESVKACSEASSSCNTSVDKWLFESSVYGQDPNCSSTSRLEKVFHLSNVGLCPAEMSPPVESRLLKRKLNRYRDSNLHSNIENSPQKEQNEIVNDEKSDTDFDDDSLITSPRSRKVSRLFGRNLVNDEKSDTDFDDSPITSPRSHKVSRLFGRNLNNEFSTKIQPTLSPNKDDTDEIDSPKASPDGTNEEKNLDDCTSKLTSYLEFSDNDNDDESVVIENPKQSSAELFRSPRKSTVQKELETSALFTPPLTEVRTSRLTRLSARKLFPAEVADEPEPQSPRTPKSAKPRKVNRTPKVNVKLLTPSRGRVDSPLRTPTTPRDRAKHALALSAAPESLPCRRKEFQTVYDFIREKISSKESGVLCINGVPGSGKTATIRRVLKKLMAEAENKKLNKFKAIEINAFDLRRSKEIYRKIYEQLNDQRKTVTIAEQLLTDRFQSKKRIANRTPVVLIIDEFDCLLTKKRDVIYKMVEWQAYDNSQLVLLTIANKLDFSDEKKLFSRIKFERLAFVAYSFKELEVIIRDRLKEFNGFKPEAIQFIARKVAATSGDARKALDICRQVLDTVEAEDEKFVFTIDYVSKLLEKIFSNPNVRIIRQLTDLEKIALRAIRDELSRTDKTFCTLWSGLWHQFEAICNMDGFTRIDCNTLLQIYAYLASIGLVKIEGDHLDQHSKIWLKCDADVIKVALK